MILRCESILEYITQGSFHHAFVNFFQDYPGLQKFLGGILLRYANPLASEELVPPPAAAVQDTDLGQRPEKRKGSGADLNQSDNKRINISKN